MMKYGLIGEKLGHSFSKEIHEMIGYYSYELCEIASRVMPWLSSVAAALSAVFLS